MSTLVDEIRRRACSRSPSPPPVMKKKRKIRIVMDEPAPKMSKADKALAREEAKFQAGRLRAMAKDKAEAMKKK